MDSPSITRQFRQYFNASPALLVRAPGRINLIGEHTDYNGGYVLPAAIDKAIWLAASARTDQRMVFYAVDLEETFETDLATLEFQEEKRWANYLLGAISELKQEGHAFGGLNLAFGGDVPLGAGLSSSAALESGMLFLLNEMFRLGLQKMDMVRLAQQGENNFVGMKCGIMDMFASVMGRAGHVVRLDCSNLKYAYFPFDTDDYALLLLDSGVKHQLVDSEYNTRRMECETGVEILAGLYPGVQSLRDVTPDMLEKHGAALPATVFRRCSFVVAEIARVEASCAALQRGDFHTVGRLMFEGHEGLDRQYEVCVTETNFLVEQARSHALGARQMGGGFGGCTINLLKNNEIEPFIEGITAEYLDTFGIELKVYPVRICDGVSLEKADTGII